MSFITRNNTGFLLMESMLALLLLIISTCLIKSYLSLIINSYQEQKNNLQMQNIFDEYIASVHYRLTQKIDNYNDIAIEFKIKPLPVITTTSLSLPSLYQAEVTLTQNNNVSKMRAIMYAE